MKLPTTASPRVRRSEAIIRDTMSDSIGAGLGAPTAGVSTSLAAVVASGGDDVAIIGRIVGPVAAVQGRRGRPTNASLEALAIGRQSGQILGVI